MSGWEIREYGGINSLEFSNSLALPVIKSPHEVLIEVYTTAVNPLDQLMTGSRKIFVFFFLFKFDCLFNNVQRVMGKECSIHFDG